LNGINAVHLLTEKLKLTSEQEARVLPILKGLYDSQQKLEQNKALSHEERLDGVRTSRQQAGNQIRAILNDDQRKMLDQLDREPHPELHGELGGPTVEQQLKVLAERLNLADDQQAKIKPMLESLQDASQKLDRDEGLSHEERLGNVRRLREQTDKQIRSLLNDGQKNKLDQLEREPHPELHG
jgi:hypothetical protein